MNVGILIKFRSEDEGGGYTISNDIFNCLLQNLELIPYKTYFIFVNCQNKKITEILNKKKISYFFVKENYFFFKLLNFTLCKFNFLLKLYNAFNLNKIRSYCLCNSIDILWSVDSDFRFSIGVPNVVTLWDLQHKTLKNYPETSGFLIKIYREVVIKKSLQQAAYIITGTLYLNNLIKKLYNIKNKIYIIPHPTPTFALNKNINQTKIKFKNYFLYPANFWSHKNHMNLLRAFKLFNDSNKIKYQMVLVGSIVDKKLYNDINDYINKNFSTNCVFILGFVSQKKLLSLYDNCLALTYLSVSGPENLPPLEAFARGKPVVYSIFKGAKEQLGKFPIYVNPNNIKSISSGLKKVLKINNKNKFIQFAKKKKVLNYLKSVKKIFDHHKNSLKVH